MPEASVIIPTKDRATLVRRAIASALAQTDVARELSPGADGGRDDTPGRVAPFGDSRVRPIVIEHSVGAPRARNRGAKVATGRWLSFLDDDDVWAPERTRTMRDAAGDAVLVAGG